MEIETLQNGLNVSDEVVNNVLLHLIHRLFIAIRKGQPLQFSAQATFM